MADPVQRLILELAKLPGIGEKTALRLAYYLLKKDLSDVQQLSQALLDAKQKIQLCSGCYTFTEEAVCSLCLDSRRRTDVLCVVEKPSDVLAIENSQRFSGKYHVLHGVLSPLDGIGPENLKLKELLKKFEAPEIEEVILAINPTVEGEATSVYLSKLLKPLGVKVSKIAHGIPVGGVLEYTDRQTIGRALENRVATT